MSARRMMPSRMATLTSGSRTIWKGLVASSAFPKMGTRGVYPLCFLKSAQVVWIEWVAAARKTSVWKVLIWRELSGVVIRKILDILGWGRWGGEGTAKSRRIVARCLLNINYCFVVRIVKGRRF